MKKSIVLIVFTLLAGGMAAQTEKESEKPMIFQETGKEATASNPDELNRKAIDLSKEGRNQEAIQTFQRAAESQDKRAARSFNNLGFAYELAGDRPKAMEAYEKAIGRDQELVPALQNLGKLLYVSGDYDRSIQLGEKVLKLEPKNSEVPQWLPDAYRKSAEKRIFELKQASASSPAESKTPEEVKKEEMKKATTEEYFAEVGLGFHLAYRYDKPGNKYSLHTQSGMINQPSSIFLKMHLNPTYQINFDFAVPYTGLLTPGMTNFTEKVEFIYHPNQNTFYGVGFMLSMANPNTPVPGGTTFLTSSGYNQLTDFKLGLVIGSNLFNGIFKLTLFPRYLFADAASSTTPEVVLDRVDLGLHYSKTFFMPGKDKKPSALRAYGNIHFSEDYVTEYLTASSSKSHYFGMYEFTAGIESGELKPVYNQVPVTIGLEFTETLYLTDLNNTAPMTFGNGQGYFGFSTTSALSGNALPGLKTNTHKLSVTSAQLLMGKIILREKLGYELSPASQIYNALHFEFSASYRF